MNILLAGGAGYIGSHTAVELLNAGHNIVVIDDYSNSSPNVLERIEKITRRSVKSYNGDVKDKHFVRKVFSDNKIDCVIHFAGLKAVGESINEPIRYYRNNIDTTLTLLEEMHIAGVNKIVFSSSATVYGEENIPPYEETMKRGSCSNPYGWTKFMMEEILEDAAVANKKLTVVLLRYFNPIGAHESGLIGEDPRGVPNNLLPYVAQVAAGRRSKLTVFGGDYQTEDGTCRRDYIHIMDLANAHLKAVEYANLKQGVEIFNIGTGNAYSVLEIIHAFELASGMNVNYEISSRREGDLPECWANVNKAREILGWQAKRDINAMCKDTWNWQKNNPEGYK